MTLFKIPIGDRTASPRNARGTPAAGAKARATVAGQTAAGAGNAAADGGGCAHTAADFQPLDSFVGDMANEPVRCLQDVTALPQHFSPLTFYGPPDSGKSSLMLSTANRLHSECLANERSAAPLTWSAAEYRCRFVTALETDSLDEFRESFLSARIVCIDNLEQLRSSPQSQLELLRQIRASQQSESASWLLFCCQTSPLKMRQLLPQLASVLAGGILMPVAIPGPSARSEIFRLLAARRSFSLKPGSLSFLSQHVAGTYPQLFAYCRDLLDSSPDSSVDAKMVCSFVRQRQYRTNISLHKISKAVAQKYQVKLDELRSKTRRQHVVNARSVAMYLARHLCGLSFQKIGVYFSNRDHSTVRHAVAMVQQLAAADSLFSDDLQTLAFSLHPHCSMHPSFDMSSDLSASSPGPSPCEKHVDQACS